MRLCRSPFRQFSLSTLRRAEASASVGQGRRDLDLDILTVPSIPSLARELEVRGKMISATRRLGRSSPPGRSIIFSTKDVYRMRGFWKPPLSTFVGVFSAIGAKIQVHKEFLPYYAFTLKGVNAQVETKWTRGYTSFKEKIDDNDGQTIFQYIDAEVEPFRLYAQALASSSYRPEQIERPTSPQILLYQADLPEREELKVDLKEEEGMEVVIRDFEITPEECLKYYMREKLEQEISDWVLYEPVMINTRPEIVNIAGYSVDSWSVNRVYSPCYVYEYERFGRVFRQFSMSIKLAARLTSKGGWFVSELYGGMLRGACLWVFNKAFPLKHPVNVRTNKYVEGILPDKWLKKYREICEKLEHSINSSFIDGGPEKVWWVRVCGEDVFEREKRYRVAKQEEYDLKRKRAEEGGQEEHRELKKGLIKNSGKFEDIFHQEALNMDLSYPEDTEVFSIQQQPAPSSSHPQGLPRHHLDSFAPPSEATSAKKAWKIAQAWAQSEKELEKYRNLLRDPFLRQDRQEILDGVDWGSFSENSFEKPKRLTEKTQKEKEEPKSFAEKSGINFLIPPIPGGVNYGAKHWDTIPDFESDRFKNLNFVSKFYLTTMKPFFVEKKDVIRDAVFNKHIHYYKSEEGCELRRRRKLKLQKVLEKLEEMEKEERKHEQVQSSEEEKERIQENSGRIVRGGV